MKGGGLVTALRADDGQLLSVSYGDVISQEIAKRDMMAIIQFELF
jgi:hypothetical protein